MNIIHPVATYANDRMIQGLPLTTSRTTTTR
jgi:hypothetical protein